MCWSIAYWKVWYDMRCYFNVRLKADISQLNLPHGKKKTKKWKKKNQKVKLDMLRSIDNIYRDVWLVPKTNVCSVAAMRAVATNSVATYYYCCRYCCCCCFIVAISESCICLQQLFLLPTTPFNLYLPLFFHPALPLLRKKVCLTCS